MAKRKGTPGEVVEPPARKPRIGCVQLVILVALLFAVVGFISNLTGPKAARTAVPTPEPAGTATSVPGVQAIDLPTNTPAPTLTASATITDVPAEVVHSSSAGSSASNQAAVVQATVPAFTCPANCTEARASGLTDYSAMAANCPKLDRDKDGLACEK